MRLCLHSARPMKSLALILFLLGAIAMTAAAATNTVVRAMPQDDGFSPAILFGLLLCIAVFVVLIGIGVVVGFVALVCTAIFVMAGVISLSVLVGMVRRRFSAGLRALHYQVSALISLPAGIGVLWLGCWIFNYHMRHRYIVAVGALIGILAGVAMAFIIDRFFRMVSRRFRRRSASC